MKHPQVHDYLIGKLKARAAHASSCREFHVSPSGDDGNDGSPSKPYRTISAAARAAQPGRNYIAVRGFRMGHEHLAVPESFLDEPADQKCVAQKRKAG